MTTAAEMEGKVNFINRAHTGIYIDTFSNNLGDNFPSPHSPGHLDHNQSLNVHQHTDAMRLVVYVDRPGKQFTRVHPALNTILWGKREYFVNTTSVIVTADAKHRVIDWWALHGKFSKKGQEQSGDQSGQNEQVARLLEAAAVFVSALATALSAGGAKYAMAAGYATLGQIFVSALGPDAPPEPPDIAEIEAVVNRVVREALQESDASKAATSFLLASEQFQLLARHTYERLASAGADATTVDLPSHRYADLMRFVESVTFGAGEHSLNFWLHHLCNQPEIAKFVLPAFVTGIATSLHVNRMHELIAQIEDMGQGATRLTIGKTTIERFRSTVVMCRNGLGNAVDAFKAYRDGLVAQEGLADTPEGATIAGLITQAHVGASSLDRIDECLSALTGIAHALDEDLQALTNDPNGKITHFWNSDWEVERPASEPPPPLPGSGG